MNNTQNGPTGVNGGQFNTISGEMEVVGNKTVNTKSPEKAKQKR